MFSKLKEKINIWYERYFGIYTPVREFNFHHAQIFFENNRNDLDEMAFCMGFDDNIWSPIIENGSLIKAPMCFDEVDGVEKTYYDIPCIYYKFKSGAEGKMYCFKEYWYNSTSKTHKYRAYMGIPEKVGTFGVFSIDKFRNDYDRYLKMVSICSENMESFDV